MSGVDSSHKPSDEAARIWRALEMTHDRMNRMEAEHEERQAQLPRIMADALKTAASEVIADPQRQAAFWQGGVAHIRKTWTAEAGRSVLGVIWGVLKVLGALLLVLGMFGPAGFKALLAAWLGGDR